MQIFQLLLSLPLKFLRALIFLFNSKKTIINVEGVILFADDHIFTEKSGEKDLFESLRTSYPVLGVANLEHAKKSLQTMSSFQAIILDYDFNSSVDEDLIDVTEELGSEIKLSKGSIKENETIQFLRNHDFYTLVYIFSNVDVQSLFPEDLAKKFGNRIKFVQKGDLKNITEVQQKILQDITVWQKSNSNLSMPIKWSNAINSSMQQIFAELSAADRNWVVNLYETANDDGVNPEIEVITLLQNILIEKLITNVTLMEEIRAASSASRTSILENENSIGKLFQRIYYTDLSKFNLEQVPVMTGDIFLIDSASKMYGIIISPECDVQDICNSDLSFELLTFKESNFSEKLFSELFGFKGSKISIDNKKVIDVIIQTAEEKFKKFNPQLPTIYNRKKIAVKRDNGNNTNDKEFSYEEITNDVLIRPFLKNFEALVNKHIDPALRRAINIQIQEQNSELLNELFLQAYNQTEKRIHLLPSFNFDPSMPNKTAVIDFRNGKDFKKFVELKSNNVKRVCKLNHPFISELRQRYNSYYGRVGVPKIPTILRKHNLNSISK